MPETYPHKPLTGFPVRSGDELLNRAAAFRKKMAQRRTVRQFSDRPVPRAVIEEAITAAGLAPSGANLQPWHFAAVSDPAVKARIRARAEEEERIFYRERAPRDWLEALAPLGTDENKPYLETAPWLIAVFQQNYHVDPDTGERIKHYYAQESTGLAAGFLLCALHHAGLASLTHTPSPMGFLRDILGRPAHEKPTMIIVTGYPAPDATVPDISKKSLSEISSWFCEPDGADSA